MIEKLLHWVRFNGELYRIRNADLHNHILNRVCRADQYLNPMIYFPFWRVVNNLWEGWFRFDKKVVSRNKKQKKKFKKRSIQHLEIWLISIFQTLKFKSDFLDDRNVYTDTSALIQPRTWSYIYIIWINKNNTNFMGLCTINQTNFFLFF